MRRRWVQDKHGQLCEVTEDYVQDSPAPLIIGDIESYQSPVTGLWVDGRKQRREDMIRTGSRPWEGKEQETKEKERREAYIDADMGKKAEVAAAKAFYSLSPEKREIIRHADGGLSEKRARELNQKYGRR